MNYIVEISTFLAIVSVLVSIFAGLDIIRSRRLRKFLNTTERLNAETAAMREYQKNVLEQKEIRQQISNLEERMRPLWAEISQFIDSLPQGSPASWNNDIPDSVKRDMIEYYDLTREVAAKTADMIEAYKRNPPPQLSHDLVKADELGPEVTSARQAISRLTGELDQSVNDLTAELKKLQESLKKVPIEVIRG